jgi:uncharacterized membrane protein
MRRGTVEHYLHDLDGELRDLPANRRRELLEEIREHIGEALAEIPDDEEAGVRNVLERVGEPAVIAEEARRRFGIRRVKPGIREILALILLPIGGFLWLIGWVVGAILLATSEVWTSREKVIGLLVVPGGLLPAFLFGLMPSRLCSETIENGRVVSESCTGGMPAWVAYPHFAVLVIGPIWAVFFLASRMNRRAVGDTRPV